MSRGLGWLQSTSCDGMDISSPPAMLHKRTLGDGRQHSSFSYPVSIEPPKKHIRKTGRCSGEENDEPQTMCMQYQGPLSCHRPLVDAMHLQLDQDSKLQCYMPKTLETIKRLEKDVRRMEPFGSIAYGLLQNTLSTREMLKLEAHSLLDELYKERTINSDLAQQLAAHKSVLLHLQTEMIAKQGKLDQMNDEERVLLESLQGTLAGGENQLFDFTELCAEAWPEAGSAPSA